MTPGCAATITGSSTARWLEVQALNEGCARNLGRLKPNVKCKSTTSEYSRGVHCGAVARAWSPGVVVDHSERRCDDGFYCTDFGAGQAGQLAPHSASTSVLAMSMLGLFTRTFPNHASVHPVNVAVSVERCECPSLDTHSCCVTVLRSELINDMFIVTALHRNTLL